MDTINEPAAKGWMIFCVVVSDSIERRLVIGLDRNVMETKKSLRTQWTSMGLKNPLHLFICSSEPVLFASNRSVVLFLPNFRFLQSILKFSICSLIEMRFVKWVLKCETNVLLNYEKHIFLKVKTYSSQFYLTKHF